MSDLVPIASAHDRDEVSRDAIVLRETGGLIDSIEAFKSVAAWDKKNDNIDGYVATTVDIRIALKKLARVHKSRSDRLKIKNVAFQMLKAAEAFSPVYSQKSLRQLLKFQIGSSLLDYSADLDSSESTNKLHMANDLLEEALFLSRKVGTQYLGDVSATYNTKAKVLYKLGRIREALECLGQAEHEFQVLYDKPHTIERDKIFIYSATSWFTSFHLTYTNIYTDAHEWKKAEHHAQIILDVPDEYDFIPHRKREVKMLLARKKS